MVFPIGLELLPTPEFDQTSSSGLSAFLNSLESTDPFICVVSRGELITDGSLGSYDTLGREQPKPEIDPVFLYINDLQSIEEVETQQSTASQLRDSSHDMLNDWDGRFGQDSPDDFFYHISSSEGSSKGAVPRLSNTYSRFEKTGVECWINEVFNATSQPGECLVSSPRHSSPMSFDVPGSGSQLQFWLDSSLQSIEDIFSDNNIADSYSYCKDDWPDLDEDALQHLFQNSTEIHEEMQEILPKNLLIDVQTLSNLPINPSNLHCVAYNNAGMHGNDTVEHQEIPCGNSVADSEEGLDLIGSLPIVTDALDLVFERDGDEKEFHSKEESASASLAVETQINSEKVCWNNLQVSIPSTGRSCGSKAADAVASCVRTKASTEDEWDEHGQTLSGQKGKAHRAYKPRKQRGTATVRNKISLRRRSEPTMVDLRGLLVNCAQSVAAGDVRRANEILHEIWLHASPFGNGTQRLSHYFAEGLMARLSGTGSRLQQTSSSSNSRSPAAASQILRAYHLFVAVCPFLKLSHFFANEAILHAAEGASRLHIVDFNILYGFQWPCFIKALAERAGGPPLLRITGIDIPLAGFEPAERVEETGRRLAEYARLYGVPLEYHAVASRWEEVQPEMLNLQRQEDEVLVVNCIYRLRHLMDETMVAPSVSPRKMVLSKIRSMNPNLFVEGVVNAGYSVPFFVSRFKEALFHFSSVFDALDTTIRSDLEERFVIEREIMGKEILNVVACEGMERLERPETYRQWQSRTQQAGFEMLPLDRSIKAKAQALVQGFYHKDYGVEDDDQGRWLLLGWKGRILHGLSTWKPSSSPLQAVF